MGVSKVVAQLVGWHVGMVRQCVQSLVCKMSLSCIALIRQPPSQLARQLRREVARGRASRRLPHWLWSPRQKGQLRPKQKRRQSQNPKLQQQQQLVCQAHLPVLLLAAAAAAAAAVDLHLSLVTLLPAAWPDHVCHCKRRNIMTSCAKVSTIYGAERKSGLGRARGSEDMKAAAYSVL